MAKEDFNLPTDYERDLDDLPLPDFSAIQSAGALDPISEVENFSEVGATNEEVVFQPEASVGGESFTEFKGWQILVEGGGLVVKLQPAKLFFPLSTGVIGGVMPTLQATGFALDRVVVGGAEAGANDWPTHTLLASTTYNLYLLYDSSADTVRAFFLDVLDDVSTVIAGAEEALLLGTVETGATEIEEILQDMFGPEAIGGGSAEPCNILLPSIVFEDPDYKMYITNGTVQPVNPAFGGGTVADDPAPSITITAVGYLLLLEDHQVTSVSDGAGGFEAGVYTKDNQRFEYSATITVETFPTVDPVTGVATDGTMVVNYAQIISDGGTGFVLAPNPLCGHWQTVRCPETLAYSLRPLVGAPAAPDPYYYYYGP